MARTAQEIMQMIREQDIQMVDFKVVDIDGQFRHVTIPAAHFNEDTMINGIGFAGMNFVMGIMDGVVVRIGLAVLMGKVLGMGVHGYWYGSAIAGYMFFVVVFPYFLSGLWKRRRTLVE